MNLLPPITLGDLFVSIPLEGEQTPSPFQELMLSLEQSPADLVPDGPPAAPLELIEPLEIVQLLSSAPSLPETRPPVEFEGIKPAPPLSDEPDPVRALERTALFLAAPMEPAEPIEPGPPSAWQEAKEAAQATEIVPLIRTAGAQLVEPRPPTTTEAPAVTPRPPALAQPDPILQPPEPDEPELAPEVEVISSRRIFEAQARPQTPPAKPGLAVDSRWPAASDDEAESEDTESPEPAPSVTDAPTSARPRAKTANAAHTSRTASPATPRAPTAEGGASLEAQAEDGQPAPEAEVSSLPDDLNDLNSLPEIKASAPQEVRLKVDDDLEVTVRRDGDTVEVTLDGTAEALEPLLEIGPELRDELARSGFELSDLQQRERQRSNGPTRPPKPTRGQDRRAPEGPPEPRGARRGRGLVDLTA